MSAVFLSIICFLFLTGSVYLHCILSFLLLCISSSFILSSLSVWNSYFIIFIYVGGMLIIVIYLASLSSWLNFLNQFWWFFIILTSFLWEVFNENSFASSGTFFINSAPEFVWSILFLSLACLFASQLLWAGGSLRSFR